MGYTYMLFACKDLPRVKTFVNKKGNLITIYF